MKKNNLDEDEFTKFLKQARFWLGVAIALLLFGSSLAIITVILSILL